VTSEPKLRICLHRGTREIDGTCIEVEAEGERIVPGIDLPAATEDVASVPMPAVGDLIRCLESPGLSLVWGSGKNIDRLVILYEACRRSGRTLVTGARTSHILGATGQDRIPQAY
jgi:hypothetical protein